MSREKKRYHGLEEAEKQKKRTYVSDPEPDMFDYRTPNYEKFERMGWTAEQTLSWLNID